MKLSHLFLCAAFSMIGSQSFAKDHGHHKACEADRAKFCADQKMGEGLGKCMKEHKAELSEACREMITDRKAAMKDCKEDAKTLCADVKGGHGHKIKCLKEHADKLSEACKAHI